MSVKLANYETNSLHSLEDFFFVMLDIIKMSFKYFASFCCVMKRLECDVLRLSITVHPNGMADNVWSSEFSRVCIK